MQNETNLPRSLWIGGGIAAFLIGCLFCIFLLFSALGLGVGAGFGLWDASHAEPAEPSPVPPLTGEAKYTQRGRN